jgi:hypothetical protein
MQAAKNGDNSTARATPGVVVERPPPGLERGHAAGPRWLIAGTGLIALLLLLAFYVRKAQRRRNS